MFRKQIRMYHKSLYLSFSLCVCVCVCMETACSRMGIAQRWTGIGRQSDELMLLTNATAPPQCFFFLRLSRSLFSPCIGSRALFSTVLAVNLKDDSSSIFSPVDFLVSNKFFPKVLVGV